MIIAKGTPLQLSPEERFLGALDGVYRRLRNLRSESRETQGTEQDRKESGWHRDIEGALTEITWARASGLYWRGSQHKDAPDVDGQEVKSTTHRDGHLIVPPDKLDEATLYVLLIGIYGSYAFAGCLPGDEVALAKWFTYGKSKGYKQFWVPQSALRGYDIEARWSVT